VIASHYAEPVERTLRVPAALRVKPAPDAEPITGLEPGDLFLMLDESLGWAWGYAGADRRVGYVPSDALTHQ
jgi:hypothetical protein